MKSKATHPWSALDRMVRHKMFIHSRPKALELIEREARINKDHALARAYKIDIGAPGDDLPDLDRYKGATWEQLTGPAKAELRASNFIAYQGLRNNWLARTGRAHERKPAD